MSILFCKFCQKEIDTLDEPTHFIPFRTKCISEKVTFKDYYLMKLEPERCDQCKAVLMPQISVVKSGIDMFCSWNCVQEHETTLTHIGDELSKKQRENSDKIRDPKDDQRRWGTQ